MISIQDASKVSLDFAFQKYCNFILSVVPKDDIIGISEIRIVDDFSNSKTPKGSVACYIQGNNGRKAIIEINITKVLKNSIPKYFFEVYHEVASLLLAEIITHEIGHHVHTFKRHGIKKQTYEKFAEKYAKAGYFNYLKSRQSKILSSYKWASWNFILFEKKVRRSFSTARQELIKWLGENKAGIAFP